MRNTPASIRERLLNKAREKGRPFNEILQYFAMERFLYRLSLSAYAEKFILKGALLFTVWQTSYLRPTMDIDLLGHTNNDVNFIVSVVKKICSQKVVSDGIVFDLSSVKGEHITEDADYEGVRIKFRGTFDTARITIQLDIGFDDIVIPSPARIDYPTILNLPAPHLYGYSKESVVAEKFEAMIKLGILNSRLKDFYDIWLLSQQFDFDGQTLTTAIKKTFSNRGTQLPSHLNILTDHFVQDPSKKAQWRGFIRKNILKNVPEELSEVVTGIADFLGPVIDTLTAGQTLKGAWNAHGPARRWDPIFGKE